MANDDKGNTDDDKGNTNDVVINKHFRLPRHMMRAFNWAGVKMTLDINSDSPLDLNLYRQIRETTKEFGFYDHRDAFYVGYVTSKLAGSSIEVLGRVGSYNRELWAFTNLGADIENYRVFPNHWAVIKDRDREKQCWDKIQDVVRGYYGD